MAHLVGLLREPEFSPGRVDDDAAILERTAAALGARGLEVELGDAALLESRRPRAILAMCQSPRALAALDRHAAAVPVINPPAAIRACFRTETLHRLAAAPVVVPPALVVDPAAASGGAPADAAPCWVKRGDVHAMAEGDVVFAPDRASLTAALEALAARGIARAVLQRHVEGTLVKFYGVADGRFFRCYADAPEPPAPVPALWEAARAGAAALALEIFGGDLVVTPDGTPVLIDVNDWPSFARCREEAAEAIAAYVCDRVAAPFHAAAPAR